jgi:DNA-binding SARP family transcriptional activator
MTDALPRDDAAAAAASTYRLRVLGATELAGGDGADAVLAQPKRLALLVYLAVARPRGFHRRDRLVTLFWPEHDQEHARAALRKAVHAIRKSLGNDFLVSRGDEEVAIDHTRLWCDAVAFDDALQRGRIALALELFRGDLLDGFFADAPGFERWLEAEREVYRESAVDAAWTLAQRYEAGAELTEATRWARRVARLTTTNERVLRRVIQLLDRVGDRAGAIRVYEEFATRVRALFDVEPSPETQALVRRIKGA